MMSFKRYILVVMTEFFAKFLARSAAFKPAFETREEAFTKIAALYNPEAGVGKNWEAAIRRYKAAKRENAA